MLALRVWSLDQDNRHRKSSKSSNKGMKWMDGSDSDVEKGLRRSKVEIVVGGYGKREESHEETLETRTKIWKEGWRGVRRGGTTKIT